MSTTGLIAREALSEKQQDEMFALLAAHFEGVTRPQFDRDLMEKNWVIEIRRDGRLLGFSTLLVCERGFEGEPITAIFSGDTIVAPEAWNSPALARTWIAAVNSLRASAPDRRCFWLLLTSGFRTYRFLPVFWREFYPRFNAVTPSAFRRLTDSLASSQYGGQYGADGIVRFSSPQRLRAALAEPPVGRANNSHVAFFLKRNPGHASGDELACITEIAESNLTAAGRRMISQ